MINYFISLTGKNKQNQYEQVSTDEIKKQSYFQMIRTLLKIGYECVTIFYHIIFKENLIMSAVSLIVPIITTLIGTHKNKLFNDFKDNGDMKILILMFILYEIMSNIIQNYFMYKQSTKILVKSRVELNEAKLKCGVKIPGINLARCYELSADMYKIREFVIVPGMIWETLISFLITINGIESHKSRYIIIISSLFTLILLIFINDPNLYKNKKYDSTKITDLDKTELVRIRFSYGATIDYNYNLKRTEMQERQFNIQQLAVCLLNLIIIWVALSSGSKQYVLNFMSITWLISCLANNIKGLQHYLFVEEYINMCSCLKQNAYQWSNKSEQVDVTSISLDKVSYGYMADLKNPQVDIKIKDLSYVFNVGKIYYIEAPNGVGKSTILRILTHNITSGNIFFGNTNRTNISWEELHSIVYHLVQASEFSPSFRKEDIDARKDVDNYLANGLCISELFGKSTDEMSGGEKQRMNLYLALTSNTSVILLDEILSEISVIPSDNHPEGLRTTVINTILGWPNKKNKLIIIVGHGVFDKYDKDDVVKLKIDVNDTITKLVPFKLI